MPFEKPTFEQLARRFTYHAPTGDQASRYETIRATILGMAHVCVRHTPCSPEQTRALNALDDAMFLFNAAIARNECNCGADRTGPSAEAHDRSCPAA